MKSFFLVSLLFFIFFSTATQSVFAELSTESNTITTRVGNPPIEDAGGVLGWTSKISNALQIGTTDNINNAPRGMYNKMLADITNNAYVATRRNPPSTDRYWCTDLVIDSYNLAGIKGLSIAQHQAVVTMVSFWKTTNSYLDYSSGSHENILKQVRPGYAIFFLGSSGDHVALVKNITIDSRGNGTLETYDANTPRLGFSYTISGWNIINSFFSQTIGFGGTY